MDGNTDIVWLDGGATVDASVVGGKGASLLWLAADGFRTPPGFTLTTAAYRTFVAERPALREIVRCMRCANLSDTGELHRLADRARDVVLAQPLPATLQDRIAASLDELAGTVGGDLSVSVRSSATAEDLPSASFAGIYETYLGVRGVEEVLRDVKRCWASSWTARAIAYREQNGFDHEGVLVAVVVQQMIPAEVSGILFTRAPHETGGRRMWVNASWGLGEGVVQGRLPSDTYVLDKQTETLVSRSVADKHTMVVAGDGGAREADVAGERRTVPCLSDAELRELARLGNAVERSFGAPQDVEWAMHDGVIFVLQCRPVTSVAEDVRRTIRAEIEALERYPPGTVWSDMLISEVVSFPKPLSAELLEQFLSREGSFGIFYEKELAFGQRFSDPILTFIAGRPYFNRTEMVKPFAFLGFPLRPFDADRARRDPALANSPYPLVDPGPRGRNVILYLARILPILPYALVKLTRRIHGAWRMVRAYHIEYRERILPAYLRRIERLRETRLEQRTDAELAAAVRRLLLDIACVSTMSHIKCEFAADLCFRIVDGLSGGEARRLVSGLEQGKHLETHVELWKLAGRAPPSVRDVLTRTPPGNPGEELARFPEGRTFVAEMDAFLDAFGHRGHNEFELSAPRWREDPSPLYESIGAYLRGGGLDPLERLGRLRQERQESEARVRSALRKDPLGMLFPVRFRVLARVLALLKGYAPLRETTKFYYLMEVEQLRRFLLEMGERFCLAEDACLNNRNDVFFLRSGEIQEIVDGRFRPARVRATVAARKRAHQTRKGIPVPPVIFREELEAIGVGSPIRDAKVMSGTGVSAGRVTGIARVLTHPSGIGSVRRGDVLVAPSTDPGWTPLFFLASALVMNTGNDLSHGAVLARECGLPAVVNVRGATGVIGSGQRVTVDGSEGKVYLH